MKKTTGGCLPAEQALARFLAATVAAGPSVAVPT
jgi:hypothetical protein